MAVFENIMRIEPVTNCDHLRSQFVISSFIVRLCCCALGVASETRRKYVLVGSHLPSVANRVSSRGTQRLHDSSVQYLEAA